MVYVPLSLLKQNWRWGGPQSRMLCWALSEETARMQTPSDWAAPLIFAACEFVFLWVDEW